MDHLLSQSTCARRRVGGPGLQRCRPRALTRRGPLGGYLGNYLLLGLRDRLQADAYIPSPLPEGGQRETT
jgi:hypothetical protein